MFHENSAQKLSRSQRFDEDVLACREELYSFAFNLTRSRVEAEDLVQHTIYKALEFHYQFTHGHLRRWLYTILKRKWFDQYKRTRVETSLEESDTSPHVYLMGESCISFMTVENEQTFIRVSPLLAGLSREHSDVLVATYYLDLKQRECAELFKTQMGTIKSRQYRALEIMQYLLTVKGKKFNVRPWATATSGISKKDAYFPIAEAYERIHGILTRYSNNPLLQ